MCHSDCKKAVYCTVVFTDFSTYPVDDMAIIFSDLVFDSSIVSSRAPCPKSGEKEKLDAS